jgi:ferritin-like metal-binding protein YciE
MSNYEQKIVRYLEEAHATELALTRALQSHVAMTPEGSTRALLQQHLGETRAHAERVRGRIEELRAGAPGQPLQAWVGLTQTVVGQAVALGKAPLDLLRGTGGEEKVLKNAKDDCAAEALEIATYSAIERLARQAGDEPTAELAAAILAEERRMLDRLLEEIPRLAEAVARAELGGGSSGDAETATAAATRDATQSVREATATAASAAERTAGERTAGEPAQAPRQTPETPAPAEPKNPAPPAPAAERTPETPARTTRRAAPKPRQGAARGAKNGDTARESSPARRERAAPRS